MASMGWELCALRFVTDGWLMNVLSSTCRSGTATALYPQRLILCCKVKQKTKGPKQKGATIAYRSGNSFHRKPLPVKVQSIVTSAPCAT